MEIKVSQTIPNQIESATLELSVFGAARLATAREDGKSKPIYPKFKLEESMLFPVQLMSQQHGILVVTTGRIVSLIGAADPVFTTCGCLTFAHLWLTSFSCRQLPLG